METSSSSRANKITESFPWELTKLLLVPVMIPLVAWLLNREITERRRIQSYFSEISNLAIKAQSVGKGDKQLKDIPILKNLARSQTLAILPSLNGESKREVIAFLANSDLHYQFSLSDANLRNANLKGLHLWHADFRGADLSGAILDDAKLQGASMQGAIADNKTSMRRIYRDHCTILPSVKKVRIPLSWTTKEVSHPSKKGEIFDPECGLTLK